MTAIERVAAFDVDGTLTTRDCVVPFMRRIAPASRLVGRLALHPMSLGKGAIRRDRDLVKAAAAMAAFEGRTLAEVEAGARSFAQEVYERRMRPDVVALLRGHATRGDTVLLVSASFEVYLRPLADLLGVDDVVATRLEVGGDERLTGRLDGPNCRGPEKVERLHRWLRASGTDRPSVHVTAYGDSPGDRELLADADAAHWVLRSPKP